MYIEYFYFTIYAGVLYVALIHPLRALGEASDYRIRKISFRVLYLPIMLGSLFVITVWRLPIEQWRTLYLDLTPIFFYVLKIAC
jgi:hypothetical protein